jgi:4-amino-4-deoxy-L-arabinose transferase-like glycosyltransferase
VNLKKAKLKYIIWGIIFLMDKKTAFALVLGLLALLGAWLLKISTPYGLGLIDDAISYVAAARALLAGQGFTRIWLASGYEPITHWPPGFPAVMAAVSFFARIDPYRSARAINVIVFGANTALLGWLGWKMTRSRVAGIFLALLFLSNRTLLRLHAYALSEPLYLFVSLLAFLAFAAYFDKEKRRWLFLSGLFVGLAYLTRYAALSLLASLLVALFVLRPVWRQRLRDTGIFLAGALPPIAAWMLRNQLVGGSATNRAVQWHPVTHENLMRGARTFFQFLLPLSELSAPVIDNTFVLVLIPFLIFIPLLVWLLLRGGKYFFSPRKNKRPPVLAWVTALYIFGYLGSLLVSLTLFDAATPLNDRILSPIYLALLILATALAAWIWRKRGAHWLIFSVALIILSVSATAQYKNYLELRETPQGFASWRWRESSVMAAIRELPPDTEIYTNQPPAVYFWTGRPAYPLWDEQPSALREGDAALAVFFPPQRGTPAFQAWFAEMTAGLQPVQKSGLGILYRKIE